MYTTKTAVPETVLSESVPFDVIDDRGRRVGVVVVTSETDFVPSTYQGGYSVAPGRYFSANVQSSRDGEYYGACQPSKHFETEDERNLWIAKRVQSAKTRAEKKFGTTEPIEAPEPQEVEPTDTPKPTPTLEIPTPEELDALRRESPRARAIVITLSGNFGYVVQTSRALALAHSEKALLYWPKWGKLADYRTRPLTFYNVRPDRISRCVESSIEPGSIGRVPGTDHIAIILESVVEDGETVIRTTEGNFREDEIETIPTFKITLPGKAAAAFGGWGTWDLEERFGRLFPGAAWLHVETRKKGRGEAIDLDVDIETLRRIEEVVTKAATFERAPSGDKALRRALEVAEDRIADAIASLNPEEKDVDTTPEGAEQMKISKKAREVLDRMVAEDRILVVYGNPFVGALRYVVQDRARLLHLGQVHPATAGSLIRSGLVRAIRTPDNWSNVAYAYEAVPQEPQEGPQEDESRESDEPQVGDDVLTPAGPGEIVAIDERREAFAVNLETGVVLLLTPAEINVLTWDRIEPGRDLEIREAGFRGIIHRTTGGFYRATEWLEVPAYRGYGTSSGPYATYDDAETVINGGRAPFAGDRLEGFPEVFGVKVHYRRGDKVRRITDETPRTYTVVEVSKTGRTFGIQDGDSTFIAEARELRPVEEEETPEVVVIEIPEGVDITIKPASLDEIVSKVQAYALTALAARDAKNDEERRVADLEGGTILKEILFGVQEAQRRIEELESQEETPEPPKDPYEFPAGTEREFDPNLFDFHWNEDYSRYNAIPLSLSEFHPLNASNPAEATSHHPTQLEALERVRASLKDDGKDADDQKKPDPAAVAIDALKDRILADLGGRTNGVNRVAQLFLPPFLPDWNAEEIFREEVEKAFAPFGTFDESFFVPFVSRAVAEIDAWLEERYADENDLEGETPEPYFCDCGNVWYGGGGCPRCEEEYQRGVSEGAEFSRIRKELGDEAADEYALDLEYRDPTS